MSSITLAGVTLDEIQPIFGGEIAGNHTVLATFEDGQVLCCCTVDLPRGTVTVYFYGHDEHLSDWDLCSEAEAHRVLAERKELARADRRAARREARA